MPCTTHLITSLGGCGLGPRTGNAFHRANVAPGIKSFCCHLRPQIQKKGNNPTLKYVYLLSVFLRANREHVYASVRRFGHDRSPCCIA